MALLLFVQLGKRELLLGHLARQLHLVFVALRQELAPFLLPLCGEQALEGSQGCLRTGDIDNESLTLCSLDESDRPGDGGIEELSPGSCPRGLLQGNRPGAAELTPDGDRKSVV